MCKFWSVIGREFTLATNQLDFGIPERFNLTYTAKDGSEKTPICIHRAPLSTHERLVGFLIEHYGGAFPVWLAPVQIKLIPVAEAFNEYAEELVTELRKLGAKVEVDLSSDSLSKKVRNSQKMKIPMSLVLGEQEMQNKTVTLRRFGSRDQETMSLEEFSKLFLEETDKF